MTTSLVFLAAGILIAPAYLAWRERPATVARSIVKTLPLAMFTMAAVAAQAHPFLAMALFLSGVGDLALSWRARRAFLYGLAAFALAHLFYVLLFLSVSALPLWNSFYQHPIAALAMVVIGLSTELWLIPHVGSVRWPVRLYVVLIGAMMLAALTLTTQNWLIVVGAVCFVASDLILAVERFRMAPNSLSQAISGALLWVLYIAGQALILWGVLHS